MKAIGDQCTVSHALARREFVRLYQAGRDDIFYGRIPAPPEAWVAHMIGLAATFSLDLRERVRAGLTFALAHRRTPAPVGLGEDWVAA